MFSSITLLIMVELSFRVHGFYWCKINSGKLSESSFMDFYCLIKGQIHCFSHCGFRQNKLFVYSFTERAIFVSNLRLGWHVLSLFPLHVYSLQHKYLTNFTRNNKKSMCNAQSIQLISSGWFLIHKADNEKLKTLLH